MAIRINLLPRRANGLIRRTRRFHLALIVTTVSALTILFIANILIGQQHDAQQQLLHHLHTEHGTVDRLISEVHLSQKRIALLEQRQRTLESLQQQRNDAVRLLDWLAQYQPQDVYLHTLVQDGNQVALTGVAASHRHITELMENLHAFAEMFRQPELQEVRAADAPASGLRQRFAISIGYLPTAAHPASGITNRP